MARVGAFITGPTRANAFLSIVAAWAIFAWVFASTEAVALQYQYVRLDSTSVAVTFTGPIVPGDFERFGTFLKSIPASSHIKAFFIDSGGGNLVEASKLAAFFGE